MHLLRLGEPGSERPALQADDGTTFDLGPLTRDVDGDFLATDGIARARAAAEASWPPSIRPAFGSAHRPPARARSCVSG